MLLFVTFICVIGSGLSDKLPTNYGGPTGPQATYGGADDQPNYNDQPTYGNELSADEQNLKMLMNSVPGTPGEDYPILSEVPESAFSCKGQKVGGYYADPEAQCQVFHVCAEDGDGPRSKWSFLCPNGTIFNQNYFICDWWFNFDCSTAESLYSLNDQLGETGDLASYNAAESQNVPTYQNSNQAAYNSPGPAPAPATRKAPAPAAAAPKSSPKAAPKSNGNGAKAAGGNYGAPAPQAPGNGYGAPTAQAPGSGYGSPAAAAPAESYGAPAQDSYGAPAETSYGAPAADESSQTNYGAPSDDYESADTNYGAPSADEALPDYSSSAPDNYGAPADSGYGGPTPAAPADSGYGAPEQASYDAPAGDNYGAPAAAAAAPEAPVGGYSSGARVGRQRSGKSAFNRKSNNVNKNFRG